MDKLEEHFEGARPRNRVRQALLAVGFVVFLAFVALFVKMSLPTQRTELVGKWKGIKPGLMFDFRGDGTFSGVAVENWVGSNPALRIAYEGQWKASHNALYLTLTRFDSVNKPRDLFSFKQAQKEALSQTMKLSLEWKTQDKWVLQNEPTSTYMREGPTAVAPSP